MATVLEPLGDGFEARSQTRLRVFEEGEGGDMDIQYGRMGDDYRDDNEATTEKELTPIVAMPPPSAAVTVNRLSKQTYSRLGRNSSFEVRPAVVHFGGYSIWKPHSQTVRVVNVARTSRRLHILEPATDYFKIRCNKKGMIAPGSSEVIAVDFFPREHRYHYDCVRLQTDGDNLLVPLHAYPVMNDVIFPTRLDFGVHAIGETIERKVKIVCKVPIQFEFEISVTKAHPHFRIWPLRGIVPANGAVKVHIEHTPTSGCSAEMEILVNVSQFNFKPIRCVVTGAARPGIIRQRALEAAAQRLGRATLEDSLGPEAVHRALTAVSSRQACSDAVSSDSRRLGSLDHGRDASLNEDGVPGKGARSSGIGDAGVNSMAWSQFSEEEPDLGASGAELVETCAMRKVSAETGPYGTGVGSGAVFDAGGEWLAREKKLRAERQWPRKEPWVPPTEGMAFGRLLDGEPKTTIVEGLVIPARLKGVQATNFVLTQQPGKLKPKDLKEAIRQARAERQRQLEEQQALRALTALPDDDGDDTPAPGDERPASTDETLSEANVVPMGKAERQPAQLSGRAICAYEKSIAGVLSLEGVGLEGAGGGRVASRQSKEISFLQELSAIESQERDREFKGSIEHIGEPMLAPRELEMIICDRRRCQRELQMRRRAAERGATETVLKGPQETGERFARAALVITGEGTQGVGFEHVPDWNLYKNDDWGKRREVLRRLVNAVGRWIVRARAGRRLAAIRRRLGDLRTRADVAAMVDHDNKQARLSVSTPGACAPVEAGKTSASEGDGWEFTDPFQETQHLAAEMVEELARGGGKKAGMVGSSRPRLPRGETPPPPEFRLSPEDVQRERFPMFDEGAATARKAEEVDDIGPPMNFIDVGLLSLKTPEESRLMGYEIVRPPLLGTYPSIESSRPMRWSAFEECGVRQPRDEDDIEATAPEPGTAVEEGGGGRVGGSPRGWRKALTVTDRRASQATFRKRRSSVGLRMLPETREDDAEGTWLAEADAELTALAAEAEKVDRMPDSLLLPSPPPEGVDLISPDPRFKPYVPEIDIDEASPEWCLRPKALPREVPITKGLLLGYSPGSTSLRAYAKTPRLYESWRPNRERRSSALSCMKGQAYRGVWTPLGMPTLDRCGYDLGRCRSGRGRGADRGHHGFQLAPEAHLVAAASGYQLSDSESEDDDEYTPPPSLAEARRKFDPCAGSPTANDDGNEASEGGSDRRTRGGNEDATDGGRTGGVFERDAAISRVAEERRCKRRKDAEVLADRMDFVAKEIRNIKNSFVLQIPYHRIPRGAQDAAEGLQGEK